MFVSADVNDKVSSKSGMLSNLNPFAKEDVPEEEKSVEADVSESSLLVNNLAVRAVNMVPSSSLSSDVSDSVSNDGKKSCRWPLLLARS